MSTEGGKKATRARKSTGGRRSLLSFFDSQHQTFECLCLERNERIEIISLAVGGGIGGDENYDHKEASDVSPEAEDRGGNEKQDAKELNGVAELVAPLSEIGYRNESHIENYLGYQPAYIHREIAKDKSAHHRERVVEHIRGVERGEAQSVYDEFNEQ